MQIWFLALNAFKVSLFVVFCSLLIIWLLKNVSFAAQLIFKTERERDVSDEGTMEFVSSSKWKSLQRDKDDAISLFNIDKGEKIRSLCFLFQKKQTNLPK
jgi:hypothetical protein